MKIFALLLAVMSAFSFPKAEASAGYELKIFSTAGELIHTFTPFNNGAPGGVAAADLGSDDIAEIVVGSGAGLSPMVKIFRQDGSLINEFLAYNEAFLGGINVAICDLDGNGTQEILTGAGYTGGPHVRAFEPDGTPTTLSFFAEDAGFRGGVNVACGDITGDGQPEIITGAGLTGTPHVNVFTAQGALLQHVTLGADNNQGGTFVTLGDTNGDKQLEIIASQMTFTTPEATILRWNKNLLEVQQVLSLGATPTHGAPVAAIDINTDGIQELAVSEGAFDSNLIKIINPFSVIMAASFDTELTTANASLTLTTLRDQTTNALIVMESATQLGSIASDKFVKVDISEQRLTAYEQGLPVKSFLVSTGTYSHPTPLGTTTVTDKIPVMTYAWFYGAGNPNNYSLPNVKYNLRFRQHFYIHSAYWHNNFGKRMSHGCVNTSLQDAEWIYNWANVGTTVTIEE